MFRFSIGDKLRFSEGKWQKKDRDKGYNIANAG
jgi:hypothetical protein